MNIKEFAQLLNNRVNRKFDSFLIVDSGGVKGTGKSVFSIKLCIQLCKLIGEEYSFEKHIIFNPTSEKIVDKIKNMPVGSPIHIDEASKVAYKRDFQKEYQKSLIKFVNICRKFGKIIILNNPDFWDLDKDLRNLSDYRIIIVKRGLAQVKGKSPNPDLKDKWLRDVSVIKIEQQMKGSITQLERTRQGIKRTPNFLYDIPVGDLDAKLYAEYEELSKREEVKSFQENTKVKDVRMRVMGYMLTNNGLKDIDVVNKLNKALYDSVYAKSIEKYLFTTNIIQKFRDNWRNALVVVED